MRLVFFIRGILYGACSSGVKYYLYTATLLNRRLHTQKKLLFKPSVSENETKVDEHFLMSISVMFYNLQRGENYNYF